MGEVEMISVKAKDYLALCNENERLNAENKRLRNTEEGGQDGAEYGYCEGRYAACS